MTQPPEDSLFRSAGDVPPPRARPSETHRLVRFLAVSTVVGLAILVGGVGLILHWYSDPRGAGDDARYLGVATEDEAGEDGAPLPAASRAERRRRVSIFFTTDGLTLQPQIIQLPRPLPRHQRMRFVLEELLRGPATEFFHSTIPEGTELLGAYLTDDVAVVDLSGELLSRPLGGPLAELLCAYAVVCTVVENLEQVRAVRILVDGQPASVLWSQVDLSANLTPDVSLVRSQ